MSFRSYVVVFGCLAGLLVRVSPAETNLLQNPGFETGSASGAIPDGWWMYEEAGQESWAAHSGTNGMAFRSWSDGTWGGFGQKVSADPGVGDVVTFRIWGLAENNYSSSTAEAWFKLRYWTNGAPNQAFEITNDVYAGLMANRGEWKRYTLTTTNVLDDVSHMEVVVGGGGFTSGDGPRAVKWDDAELTFVPAGQTGFSVHSYVDEEQVFHIGWSGSTSVYYRIWYAEELDGNWRLIRGMALGKSGAQIWNDAEAVGQYTSLYYKVAAKPVTYPGDYDADGLDDVTELSMGNVDPLDPDSDGDSINDGVDPRPANPNEAPDIQDITSYSSGKYHNDAPITITVQSSDADGDAMEYRSSLNGGPFSSWQSGHQFVWTPPSDAFGRQLLRIEVRDPWGAVNTDFIEMFIFRTPPRP